MDIKELHKALKTGTKPRKDECEDWNIFGEKGKIYLDHTYWYAYVYSNRIPRKELKFMVPWQGDAVFRSDKLPTEEEAAIVRRIVGLKKKRELSAANRAKAIERLQKFRYNSRSPG